MIQPYAEYMINTGPVAPLLSAPIWSSLAGIITLLLLFELVKYTLSGEFIRIPFLFFALLPTLALLYVGTVKVYPRKKKQQELYETLTQSPEKLLDDDYRVQFNSLLEEAASPSDPPSVGDAELTESEMNREESSL